MSDIKIPQAKEFFEAIQVKENAKNIRIEFLSRVVTIIIAGLALITALAWDEVLRGVYDYFLAQLTMVNEKLGYALFITLVSVVVSIIIGKFFIKKKERAEEL